ncbi:MAG: hypothetical protein ABIH34_04015 [Nanoarchaeota archaeon]
MNTNDIRRAAYLSLAYLTISCAANRPPETVDETIPKKGKQSIFMTSEIVFDHPDSLLKEGHGFLDRKEYGPAFNTFLDILGEGDAYFNVIARIGFTRSLYGNESYSLGYHNMQMAKEGLDGLVSQDSPANAQLQLACGLLEEARGHHKAEDQPVNPAQAAAIDSLLGEGMGYLLDARKISGDQE